MLSAAAIVGGYAALVLSFGWAGVAASVAHILIMLISTAPGD